MKQLISQHAHKWAKKGDYDESNKQEHDIYSLAQGVVYWRPPSSAYEALSRAIHENMNGDCDRDDDGRGGGGDGDGRLIHTYCPDEGYPPLLSALKHKLQKENGLSNPHVMVTSGANQAYVNCVLTLLDEKSIDDEDDDDCDGGGGNISDKCVVFQPYYFNHVMAVQSIRGGRGCDGTAAADYSKSSSSCDDTAVEGLLVGPTIRGVPDLKWLRSILEKYKYNNKMNEAKNAIKMVTLVNPGNPTGISLPYRFLEEIVQLTKEYGVWLIMDNTYEHFDVSKKNTFPPMDMDGINDDDITQKDKKQQQQPDFPCFDEEHVINIFSFSKGYAMAGFRVGYIALSSKNGNDGSGTKAYMEMLKVQDTIAICASRISQMAALGALQAGRDWVYERVTTLDIGRTAIMKAMSSLEDVIGGDGAMYIMGKLPDGVDDWVSWGRIYSDMMNNL